MVVDGKEIAAGEIININELSVNKWIEKGW